MDNIFDILFEKTDSAESLDKFLRANMQTIDEFYNSNYGNILLARNSIERFILLKYNVVSQLDYSTSYSRSFLLMLLDYCERFNFIAATPRVCSILQSNQININCRQQAAVKFLYPKPETNSELVDRFESICEKLQFAIDTEEDNDKKSLATFLNYYGIIINDTSIRFVEQIKEKIVIGRSDAKYSFLQSEAISELINIDYIDKDVAYVEVQDIIDRLLGKENISIILEFPKIESPHSETDILIETETNYSRELISIPNNFDSIRSISLRYADGRNLTNRGVKIIDSEAELYEYMRRFGNMHKAKLKTALESLPNNFLSKVDILDWGCGQGIASMIFMEGFGVDNIKSITLIEPSDLAIKRAALHVKKYNQNIPIRTIQKKLDDLHATHFINEQSEITIHLFSNILDIDDYSQNLLLELIDATQTGLNYFVCVSPYIDEIKTERLQSFKRYFENRYHSFELLLSINNSKNPYDDFWCCNNTFKNNSTSHGSYFNCNEYTENGCNNKWTRVINVFKVYI